MRNRRRLTDAQRALVDAGKAVVAHCPTCRDEFFVAGLPDDMAKVAKLMRDARCENDPSHVLYMGPLPSEKDAT